MTCNLVTIVLRCW